MATVKTADGTTIFEHSFTSPTADLILRSSDSIDFRVHKLFLSDVSPVFADMFSLPQPNDSKDILDGLPVVPLSEDSKIVNTLLEFCYPSKVPKPTDLDELRDVLIAADKYSMSEAIAAQCEGFLRRSEFLEKEPWRVYGIACRWGLADLAKAAAKETLKQPVPQDATQGKELQHASGLSVFKLFCYRHKCASLINPLVDDGAAFLTAFRMGDNFCNPELAAHTGTGWRCPACQSKLWNKNYLNIIKNAFVSAPYGGILLQPSVIVPSTAVVYCSGCVSCNQRSGLVESLIACNVRIGRWLDAEIAKVRPLCQMLPPLALTLL